VWRREEINLSSKAKWRNRLGSILPLNAVDKFTGDDIVNDARAKTRLKDFGGEGFREGLDKLLDSVFREGRLHWIGRGQLKQACIMQAANRLRIQRAINQDPELLRRPIAAPLFIVGLPRTGGALLQRLLAQDPANRCLKHWESDFSAPFPAAAQGDPRAKLSGRILETQLQAAPRLRIIHIFEAEGPAECGGLFASDFSSFLPSTNFSAPAYTDWLLARDMTDAYKHYKRQLQILDSAREGKSRWALKSPGHLPFVEALLKVFPDARFVQTHREPEQAVPSFCSFSGLRRSLRSNRVDPNLLGRQWTEWLAQAAERGMQARAKAEDAWQDVGFETLIAKPLETVRNVYDRLGWTLSEEAEQRMTRLIDRERKRDWQAHRYSLAQFGLTSAAVRQRFAAYRERFGELIA